MLETTFNNDPRCPLNAIDNRLRHQEQSAGLAAASFGDPAFIDTQSADDRINGPLANIDWDALEATCRRHSVRSLTLSGSTVIEESGTDSGLFEFVVEFLPLSPARRADAYFSVLWTLRNALEWPIHLVDKDAVVKSLTCERAEQRQTIIYAG
ncbi:MAG: hypothetical protein ACKVQA_19025 [Burkholderiales bacterium]